MSELATMFILGMAVGIVATTIVLLRFLCR